MKIASYNIENGGLGREPLIHSVIEQLDADVLVLQEAVNLRLIQTLAEKQGLFFYGARGNSRYNLALLSKTPLSYQNSFHPLPLKHTLLEGRLKRAGFELSLFGIHLAPYPFLLFEAWRLVELSTILSRIQRLGEQNCILCGDFNSVAPGALVSLARFPVWMQRIMILTQGGWFPRWVIKKMIRTGFVDCYRALNGDCPGGTLPAADPNIRLDYFFVSPALQHRLISCQPVEQGEMVRTASDHLPVLLELDI